MADRNAGRSAVVNGGVLKVVLVLLTAMTGAVTVFGSLAYRSNNDDHREITGRIGAVEVGAASMSTKLDMIHDDVKAIKADVKKLESGP